MGRPTDYSPEIALVICERIAADESLVQICKSDGMPGLTTVYRWRDEHVEFRANYARAREAQGHTVADTLGEIRKGILSGEVEPQAGRAAADIAKWEASRRASKDFGDKVDLTTGGEKIGLAGMIEARRVRAAIDG